MYFFRKGKDQHLDLRGNLILSHNDVITKVRSKSAGPVGIQNAEYALIHELSFLQRIGLLFKVISFIWGKDQSLKPCLTSLRKPHVNDLDDSKPPTDYERS